MNSREQQMIFTLLRNHLDNGLNLLSSSGFNYDDPRFREGLGIIMGVRNHCDSSIPRPLEQIIEGVTAVEVFP